MTASEIHQQKRMNLDGAESVGSRRGLRSFFGRDGGSGRMQLRDGQNSACPTRPGARRRERCRRHQRLLGLWTERCSRGDAGCAGNGAEKNERVGELRPACQLTATRAAG
jgi:hypothetical protein